ncbi:MAG: hypothetical protein AB1485_00065 [Candidatus Thermoplasmatota archaeon]
MKKIALAEEDVKAGRVEDFFAFIKREFDRREYIRLARSFGFDRCKNCNRLVFITYAYYCKKCFEKIEGRPVRGYQVIYTDQFAKDLNNLTPSVKEIIKRRLEKMKKHPLGTFLYPSLELIGKLEGYYSLYLGVRRYSVIYTLNESQKIINLLILYETKNPFRPGLFFTLKKNWR